MNVADITKDTPLSEIMNSGKAIGYINGVDTLVNTYTNKRIEDIQAEESRGLSPEIKLNSTSPIYEKGLATKSAYRSVQELSETVHDELCKAALNEEIAQLEKLIEEYDKEIKRLDGENGEIAQAESNYNTDMSKINQTIIQKGVKFSTYVYLTGIPGIALYIYDESSRKKAKNQVEDYYKGSKGKITLLNAELSDWKEKKTKAETRLSEKESELSKYSGAGETDDYDEKENNKNKDASSKDPTKVDDSDGKEKDNTKSKAETHSKGDKIKIDGEEYTVEGYVTDEDGNTIGIYKSKTGCLYYINEKGEVEPVQAKMTKYKNANLDFDKYVYENATDESIRGTEGMFNIKSFNKYVIDGKEYTYDSVADTGADSRTATQTIPDAIEPSNVEFKKDSNGGVYYKNPETGDYESIPWDVGEVKSTTEHQAGKGTFYGGVEVDENGNEYDAVTIDGTKYKIDLNDVEYMNNNQVNTTTVLDANIGQVVESNGANYECSKMVYNGTDYKKVFTKDNQYYYYDGTEMKKVPYAGGEYVIGDVAYKEFK